MLKDILGYLALVIVLNENINQSDVEKDLRVIIGERTSIDDLSPNELIEVADVLKKYVTSVA